MGTPLMVHLTMAGSMFEARVVMARLGADGILAQVRGGRDGPYPLPGPVEVLVIADQADEARQLLLADSVEALFDGYDPAGIDDGASP